MKRYFALSLVFVSTSWCQVDTQSIVRKSIENCQRDWQAGVEWSWTQTDVSLSDAKKEETVSEVVPVMGTPYERLVSKDGRPLSAEERRRELRKYQKLVNQREKETPAERAARLRRYAEERGFIKDIPNAYNFALAGEDIIDGRSAWVLRMTPRSGFVPTAPHAAMLEHFEGKLFVDKQDLQWSKAEARAMDTVSIGWIIARVEPGTRFTFEQSRIADGLWMPKRLTISGLVRLMMVYGKNLNEEVTYSDYHLPGQLQAGTR